MYIIEMNNEQYKISQREADISYDAWVNGDKDNLDWQYFYGDWDHQMEYDQSGTIIGHKGAEARKQKALEDQD